MTYRNVLVALTALLLAAFAAAQADTVDLSAAELEHGVATGYLTGQVDGEPFTVYSILDDEILSNGGPTNSAQWEDRRNLGMHIQVDIGLYESSFLKWNGAFSLELQLTGDLELVQYDDVPDITYFRTLTQGFRMTSGSLELSEATWVDDETLRLSGSFAGIFRSPISGEEVEIAAEFVVERATPVNLPF